MATPPALSELRKASCPNAEPLAVPAHPAGSLPGRELHRVETLLSRRLLAEPVPGAFQPVAEPAQGLAGRDFHDGLFGARG